MDAVTKAKSQPQTLPQLAPLMVQDEAVELETLAPTQRRCIVSRVVQDKAQMLRFVLDPQDQVVFDCYERLPGRGLWVSCDQLGRAIVSQAFMRAAKKKCTLDAQLADKVLLTLHQQLLRTLSMARKRGALILGREKIVAAMSKHRAGFLMLAQDIGADSLRLYHPEAHAGAVRTLPFNSEQLAKALGRAQVAAIYVSNDVALQRSLLMGLNKVTALA